MVSEALVLFAGAADGWGVGLKRAGIRPIALAESEPDRRAALRNHHPEAVIYDDVRHVTRERLLSDLGRLPSVVVGSPPCQDISSANNGKARGVDGERSSLYFDFIRIVGEVRPDWYAAENSDRVKTRGYDRLHAALEAVGYTCWPSVVGACEVGYFHLRKRSWLAGVDAGDALGAHRPRPRAAAHADRDGWEEIAQGQRCDLGERQASTQGACPSDAADASSDVELQQEGADGEVGRRSGDGRVAGLDADADGQRTRSGWRIAQSCAGEAGRYGSPEAPASYTARQSRRSWIDGSGRQVRAGGNEGALPPGLAAIERAAQALGLGGRTRLAEHYRMADGVSARLARACVSAYGDALVPDIAEGFGRVMPQLVAELREGRL